MVADSVARTGSVAPRRPSSPVHRGLHVAVEIVEEAGLMRRSAQD